MADDEEQDDEIDRLYALPLEEFTAARDELARRRRSETDAAAGDAVKQLRKPSVAAWALNQVRRSDPERCEALIDAGGRLREAHERLLSGGERESLEQAVEDERRLVVEVASEAERELASAGRSTGGALQEKLRATLHAVASDVEAREAFIRGRLVREHEASGFGPLAVASAAAPAAPKGRRQPPKKANAALERKARRLEERLERGRARQRELDEDKAESARRLREARGEAARAGAKLERAEAAEQRARERAEEAAASVKELEGELREVASKQRA